MTTLVASGITDPGQVRTQNQDTFLVEDDLVLIADGMGGYAGGEVAAQIAADVVGDRFADDRSADGLRDAVADANRQIYERGVEPGLEGMGTTLVALAVVDPAPRLLLVNVGDSRAYLLRDGSLSQLTEDHSVAAELVRLGRLEEDEGAEHPGRHVLTRALGVERDVEPDLIEIEPEEGDRVLLCSDGLSNELDDEAIRSMLAVGGPSDAARALVAAANAHGGLDNITAVVADVIAPEPERVSVDAAAVVPVAAGGGSSSTGSLVTSSVAPSAATTTTVGAVASTSATHRVTSVLPSGPTLAVRPVLTSRERRRRRREDRRARRAYNKWVSFRGTLFLPALVGVLVVGFAVLRWYGTENYVVTVRGDRVVILQGQPGGFLWWPQRVVVTERFGVHQVPVSARSALRTGVSEPSLRDAERLVANMHGQWRQLHGHTSTGTSTTTAPITGGT